MARNRFLPTFPNSYKNHKAREYDGQKYMERNQKKTALECIQFLFDEKLGIDDLKFDLQYTVLDLGSGTGFSSEILMKEGFRVVGVEILTDMISIAREKYKDSHYNDLDFIQADINHLPIRDYSFDHAFSVSAYNFIIHTADTKREQVKLVNNTAKDIKRILKTKGRLIIEFYPNSDEELELFSKSFTENGFKGYMIKDNPNQKAGKTFLLLKKR